MATRINGLPPMPPAGAPAWQEHRTPDGRFYYYNPMTKVTQWTKPEEMMTPAEVRHAPLRHGSGSPLDMLTFTRQRALLNQPWKEYTAEGGRKYWYNAETKQTTWDMPEVFQRALGGGTPTTPAYVLQSSNAVSSLLTKLFGSTPAAPFLPQASARPAHGGLGFDSVPHESYRDQRDGPIGESRQLTFGNNAPTQSFVPATNEPDYASPEEAEAAFVKLLKRMNVQPDWSWEQALRVIVKDPQYRAIRDPKDRKAAFEQFCHDVIAQDKERARERLTKLRADFTTMLKRHPEIKYYTRWKTARPMIEGETTFRSTNDESERRLLFEEYVQELRKAQREAQATTRKSAMDGLIELLQHIDIQPSTRWSEAQAMIQSAPPFNHDEKYRSLSRYDMLTAFQNHLRTLERKFNESRQDEKAKKQRKERQARDAFADLLNDLKRDGKIKAGTKWAQIFPLIENQPAYKNMVGQGGSTPLDLFWDVVEEAENSLRTTRNDVWDVLEVSRHWLIPNFSPTKQLFLTLLQDKRFEVTAKTTFPEFLAVLQDDRRSANIDRETLTLIFERVRHPL
jgi:pre-mRNA-processing factor 40